MESRSPKQQGTGNASILAPGDVFTPDDLRKIFKNTKGRLVVPGDTEIANLSNVLNWWKRWFFAAQEAKLLNEKMKKAEEALATLREVMPAILEHHTKAADAGDPFAVWMAKAAREFSQAIPSSQTAHFVNFESLPDHAKDWRWLIKVLPIDYKKAMLSTNPNAKFGVSKKGPLAKFLEAVIPQITGERPTAVAIGTQLILASREGEILATTISPNANR
jgi:hypothetical protein